MIGLGHRHLKINKNKKEKTLLLCVCSLPYNLSDLNVPTSNIYNNSISFEFNKQFKIITLRFDTLSITKLPSK